MGNFNLFAKEEQCVEPDVKQTAAHHTDMVHTTVPTPTLATTIAVPHHCPSLCSSLCSSLCPSCLCPSLIPRHHHGASVRDCPSHKNCHRLRDPHQVGSPH